MASSNFILATRLLLLLYLSGVLWLVIRGARKVKSMSDYAVGSVQFSPMAVGLSLAASITSAATFIINPGFVALYGLSAVLAMGVILPIFALISLYILTKGFRNHGAALKALTMAQWIGKRYDSPLYALFFAFLSLLLLTFIVLICVGLTSILAQSLNAEPLYVLIGIVVFVFGYMMFGGANSMVYTNLIQALLMLVVACVLLSSGYKHFSEGVSAFLDKLHSIDPALVAATNPESFLFRDFFEVILCNAVVGVAILCQPHIITKSLMLKSDRDVNVYLRTGILAEILFFMVILVGLYARLEFPNLEADGQALKMDSIVSAYVVRVFPVGLGLVVVLGLISAGLSTLEGLIQSLSTTITSDILKSFLGERFFENERRAIWLNRLVIVVLAVLAIFLSYEQIQSPNLSVGIFAQNGVYAYFSAAFVPVLFGTFLRDTPLIAPVAATITAVVVHFGVYYGELTWYMQSSVKNPAVAATFAILSSLLVGGICYLIFRNKNKGMLSADGTAASNLASS